MSSGVLLAFRLVHRAHAILRRLTGPPCLGCAALQAEAIGLRALLSSRDRGETDARISMLITALRRVIAERDDARRARA